MKVAGEKVLVVGLGKSGISAARYLTKKGARVSVSEIKTGDELDPHLILEVRELGVRLECGTHRESSFLNSDLIVISPGVPLDIGPLKAARERGIPVIGEMELASRAIEIPILAVTGTNGKSTVTAFLGSMLEGAGCRVFVGGNIGRPLIDYPAEGERADYAVVEVSSFQLDAVEKFHPTCAIILNISPDHLDRYESFEAYARSKLKIFQNMKKGDTAIVNDDDRLLREVTPTQKGLRVLRYGWQEKRNRHAFMNGTSVKAFLHEKDKYLFSVERFSLPGRHNMENLMPAILVGLELGLEPALIQQAIDGFKGLPHRLEHVASINGIDFYNDSKATNVDAASKSISSFHSPVVLIAGGRHKGGDYSQLAKVAKKQVKRAVLLGESKDLIAKWFEGTVPYSVAEDMEDAVSQAFLSAKPGYVVVLAPACSSFDMFSDYAQRGNVFKEAVRKLVHGN